MKKIRMILLFTFCAAVSWSAMAGFRKGVAAEEVPTLKVGYIFTTHHTPLIAALAKGEQFRDNNIYLKPVVPKEKYELYEKGKKLANLEIVVNKSGAETTTMFAMNRLDVALASITAIMSGVDKGTPVKVLCPLHTDGMGLVFPKESTVKGWNAFIAHIKSSKRPVSIG